MAAMATLCLLRVPIGSKFRVLLLLLLIVPSWKPLMPLLVSLFRPGVTDLDALISYAENINPIYTELEGRITVLN